MCVCVFACFKLTALEANIGSIEKCPTIPTFLQNSKTYLYIFFLLQFTAENNYIGNITPIIKIVI